MPRVNIAEINMLGFHLKNRMRRRCAISVVRDKKTGAEVWRNFYAPSEVKERDREIREQRERERAREQAEAGEQ